MSVTVLQHSIGDVHAVEQDSAFPLQVVVAVVVVDLRYLHLRQIHLNAPLSLDHTIHGKV